MMNVLCPKPLVGLLFVSIPLISASAQEVLPAYSTWASDQGIPAALSGYSDTPAGDNVPNLLKFATGANALTPVKQQDLYTWNVNEATGSIEVYYNRKTSAEGVVLIPEFTPTLEADMRAIQFGLERVLVDGDYETWHASLPLHQKGFFRLTAGVDDALLRERYRSPFEVAYNAAGNWLATTDREQGVLYFINAAAPTPFVAHSVVLHGEPCGLTWTPDNRVFVAEYGANTIAEIEFVSGIPQVVRRIPVEGMPFAIKAAPAIGKLVVSEYGLGRVYIIDIETGSIDHTIPLPSNGSFLEVNHAQSLAVVGNLVPGSQSAFELINAAKITLIDLLTGNIINEVSLPEGSSSVRDIEISSDDNWAYVAHTYGSVAMPTNKLDNGWVSTNAISIIDLRAQSKYATLLLDKSLEGWANPWGIALSPDNETLWVTSDGTHRLGKLQLARLHKHLDGSIRNTAGYSPNANGLSDVWEDIWAGRITLDELDHHFSALHGRNLFASIDLPAKGPRGVDVSPIDNTVAVASYFTGKVLLVNPDNGRTRHIVDLGPIPEQDDVRRGQIHFADAMLSRQFWIACTTCHPEARTDGLNWDLGNDGLGTYKNTKSLVGAEYTAPTTWTGIRLDATQSIAAGFVHIHFTDQPESVSKETQAYLAWLRPEPSPHLIYGELSEKAIRGKQLFQQQGCVNCHSGDWLTDLKLHNVGTATPVDGGVTHFDTPSIVEMWRTGPYLHDGRATSLEEVFNGSFGGTHNISNLSQNDQDALLEYVRSL